MKKSLTYLAAFLTGISLAAPQALAKDASGVESGKYLLDKSHASITFSVNHLGFSYYTGRFNSMDGTLVLDTDKLDNSTLKVTVNPASVDTNNEVLEKKLRDEAMFNVQKFPVITLDAISIKRLGTNHATVLGEVSWMGVVKPLELDVVLNGHGTHPYTGKKVIGFSATGKLSRSMFGLSEYLPAVGDEVQLRIEAEFEKDEPAVKKH